MKNHIKSYQLWESENLIPGMRLPIQVELNQDEIEQVKNVKWEQLNWEDIGNDGKKLVWLDLISPFSKNIKDGIIVDIQPIGDHIYQIHINLAKSLQRKGLGSKIYRSLVDWAGHLYSGKGRRHNPTVNKIWKDLKDQEGVTCLSSRLGDICISNKNPEKELLQSIFNKIS